MATGFNNLPAELRCMVWKYAATNNGEGRFIECKWAGAPYYQKSSRRVMTMRRSERAHIRYRHRVFELSRPLGTLCACAESRAVTLRYNPNYLQLNRGHKIYFNSATDVIYFDLLDLFYMHQYCGNMMLRTGRLNVHGFDEILNLARPRAHNFRGLQDLRDNEQVGPLMPNIETVTYRHRENRVTTVWNLDYAIQQELHQLAATLPLESQRAKVAELNMVLGLRCAWFIVSIHD